MPEMLSDAVLTVTISLLVVCIVYVTAIAIHEAHEFDESFFGELSQGAI